MKNKCIFLGFTLFCLLPHCLCAQIGDDRVYFLKKILQVNQFVIEICIDNKYYAYAVASSEEDMSYQNTRYYFSKNNVCIAEIKSFPEKDFKNRLSSLILLHGNPTEGDNFYWWKVQENGFDAIKTITIEYDGKFQKNITTVNTVITENAQEVAEIYTKMSSNYSQKSVKRLR